MSCCLRILIKNLPRDISAQYLDADGQLWLDVGDSRPKLTTKSGALNLDTGKAFDEAALGFTLPLTKKNQHYFEKSGMFSPNTVDPVTAGVDVFVLANTYALRQNKLFVKGVKDNGIEIELVQEEGSWWAQASELKLYTLDFGSYVHNQTTIEAQWGNPDWQDADPMYYHPLIHYGGFRDGTDEVWLEDFRPFLPVLGVLRKGFCEIGWEFQSPILEGDEWGRRLWMYLLKPDFWDYSNRGVKYRFSAEYSVATLINPNVGGLPTPHVTPDTVTYDPYGHWAVYSGVGRYTNNQRPFKCRFRLQGDITLVSNSLLHFGAWDVNNQQLGELKVFATAGTTTIDAVSDCFYLPVNASFKVVNLADSNAFTAEIGFELSVEVCDEDRIYEGDTVQINELVDEDITLLDIVKGLSHLGLRLHADYANKQVYLFPETLDKALLFGGSYDGFYQAGANMTYIGESGGSCKVSKKTQTPKNRFVRFAFKKSTDAYVKRNELEADAPLFSQEVDLGTGKSDKIKDLRNPIFEPTADIGFGSGARIPAMWDNKDGKVSTDIAPRILFAHGYIKQSNNGAIAQFTYEGYDQKELMPYMSQLNTMSKDDGSGGTTFMDGNVAYGDSTGLHSTYMYRALLQLRSLFLENKSIVTAELIMTMSEFISLPFRSVVLVKWQEKDVAYFIESVNDWDVCDWSCKLTLIPVTSKYNC